MVVGMILIDHLSSIELFNQEKAGYLVWKDVFRKAPSEVSASEKGIVHAVGTTDHEDEPLARLLPCFIMSRKSFRAQLGTSFVEQNDNVTTRAFIEHLRALNSSRHLFLSARRGQEEPRRIATLSETVGVVIDSGHESWVVLFANRYQKLFHRLKR